MDSSVCLHCKRSIPAISIDLHTAHCARFIQLCSKCEEPIAVSEMEKHINEYHSSHVCDMCNIKVEAGNEWRKHQAQNCTKQTFLPCQFCELDCLSSNLNEHETACGSRSEMCNICNNYILKRVLKAHMELHDASSSHSSPQYVFPSSLEIGNQLNQNFNHAILNKDATRELAQLENVDITLIPCEFCQVAYAIEDLEEHQFLCGTVDENCARCYTQITRNQRFLHVCSEIEDAEDDDYWSKYSEVAAGDPNEIINQVEEDSIPCEICGTRFPLSCLELHEIACKFSAMSVLQEEKNGKQNDTNLLANAEATQMPSSRGICNFCNTYVASEVLEIHQARCMRFQDEKRPPKPLVKRNEDRNEKKSVKVERDESAVQRSVREKALLAAANRETTNPKIPQSKMKVVQLPNGQQILKKANPASDQGHIDVGHKLGRGESAGREHQNSTQVPGMPERYDRYDYLDEYLGARPKNQIKPKGNK